MPFFLNRFVLPLPVRPPRGLQHLDASGRAQVGKILRGILRNRPSGCEDGNDDFGASTILIILQDLAAEELEESFDQIDEVVKADGKSSVRLGDR